jgi:hypothetical protein
MWIRSRIELLFVNLRSLVYRQSRAPFWASRPPLWASTALFGSSKGFEFWLYFGSGSSFHSSADPSLLYPHQDPLVRATDPWIRIRFRTKMPPIPNTALMRSLLDQEEPSPCSKPGQDCEVAMEATAGCAVEQPIHAVEQSLHAVEQPLQQDRAPTCSVEQPLSRDAMDGKGQGSAIKRWILLSLFSPEAKFLVPDGGI